MAYFQNKKNIVNLSVGPHESYCVGYPYTGGYITAIVMNVNSFPVFDKQRGSYVLNSIMAFDNAEISGVYMGQINMQMVSSFCGPEGLIWGYDIASHESESQRIEVSGIKDADIEIISGDFLHAASKELFGTKENKKFPILPGSHVPCAARFDFKSGPTTLYAMVAVAIPEDRASNACLFMEDIGTLLQPDREKAKQITISRFINSIIWIGKSHKIKYRKIILYYLDKQVPKGEIGCALTAIPYFHLAKKAITKNITSQTLSDWKREVF